MSWLNDLYLTYEACKDEAGMVRGEAPLLLPIGHSTQNAQIEVILDEDGNFRRACRVEKEDAVTVIPITEDSASRSGKAEFPHPLADKLEYIAGDYGDFVTGSKKEKYRKYIAQLEDWADSAFSVQQVKSVCKYLKKGTLMHDLMAEKLFVFKDGIIVAEKQQGAEAENWFVRFSVEIPGREESRLYCDKEVFESYMQYCLSRQEEQSLCYISGKTVPCTRKHPSKIRHTGDKAKLISANDTSGFTFRGRFDESSQVAGVSYEVSQKAHSALRWLIEKQACLRVGEQVFVVWSVENRDMKKDPFDEFYGEENEEAFTDEAYAGQVKKAIWGSTKEPEESESVILMGVEAATTGRLSIPFYQKYAAKQFVRNIAAWKTDACWVKSTGKDKTTRWSPSLVEIVRLAADRNDKLNKSMRERLLPCIAERRKLPYDVVSALVQKAGNPTHFENRYKWEDGIAAACALLRKWQIDKGIKKEECNMALNEENLDRSYLFGRLLATAEMLERKAMGKDKERNTAAEKYFVRFQHYPVATWDTIRKQLQPYVMKLNALGQTFYADRMDELTGKLDFTEKGKLEPTFLQGYSSQLTAYRNFKNKDSEAEENSGKE